MIHRASLGLVGLSLAASFAHAGTIHGQVVMPPVAVSPASDTGAGRAPPQDATVVFVDGLPEPVERKLARRASKTWRIIQSQRQFRPGILAIAAGDSLVIQNQDAMFHGALSVTPGALVNLGKNAPRHYIGVRFRKPGPIRLQCDIHPNMSASLFVAPNHAFSISSPSGSFSLPKLPPGSYRVRAWHPRLGEVAKVVELPRRGNARVTLRF